MGGAGGESPCEGSAQWGTKPDEAFQDFFTSSRKTSLASPRRGTAKKLKVKPTAYKISWINQEQYYPLNKFKPVTASANPLPLQGWTWASPARTALCRSTFWGAEGGQDLPPPQHRRQRAARSQAPRDPSDGSAWRREDQSRAQEVFQARWFNAERKDTQLVPKSSRDPKRWVWAAGSGA